ncbi:hypothetical protein B0181_03015 [Moraxella caviae]|uniref:Uncharacterized protein n=1 Tax=Moraxella caviae TaxID=34060 RepID=A0A1T0A796_9GAMM|nr:hypothetical protein B0181_03015 [Moraxella caviae]
MVNSTNLPSFDIITDKMTRQESQTLLSIVLLIALCDLLTLHQPITKPNYTTKFTKIKQKITMGQRFSRPFS